jgi:hypothetical protein
MLQSFSNTGNEESAPFVYERVCSNILTVSEINWHNKNTISIPVATVNTSGLNQHFKSQG